ncbi:hypothetical protein OG799_25635 [Micromonospora sp. NBC_00898]|uniref:hypothetical protein n=1 Tax=Micromonospora sp. NBC_00898 TaxID=2975981 RepID=UPI00386C4F17|nr:hypothetical protein OG799_25635 [Micromonospora sp. NBC_00898]
MTSGLVRRRDRWNLPVTDRAPAAAEPEQVPGAAAASEPNVRMHTMLVCVRLTAATPGSRLLDFLHAEPCAVQAWWIAADIDAVVLLSSPSRTALHRAVADLRRRGGAEVVAAHTILRPLDLAAAGMTAAGG